MKKELLLLFFAAIFILGACKKEKTSAQPILTNCQISDSISYMSDVKSILDANCIPCHQYPGAGGINLDSYNESKNVALSGQLVQSIIHDTNYVIMPPPPQKQLDSCQIKTIKKWIEQGCME